MRRAPLLLAALAALALPAGAAAAGPPQVNATWVTDVAATSATFHAQVNPEGLPTAYRFQYIPAASYEANVAAGGEGFAGAAVSPPGGGTLGGGSGAQNLLVFLGGLAPSTAYRYRLLAENEDGLGPGPPRSFRTLETAPVFALPDARGWELVSPPDKDGGSVGGPGQDPRGQEMQAAAGGGAVTYSSSASFAAGAASPVASQYLAGRGTAGWSTENITAPASSTAEPSSGPLAPYRAFSEDLATALLAAGGECLTPTSGCADPSPPPPGSGGLDGYEDLYLRDQASGAYRALITTTSAPALSVPAEAFSVSFAGATPDLGHVVISTCAALITGATQIPEGPGCEASEQNLYEWSAGNLHLVNVLPGDMTGTPGARLAAPSGAISADGERVYFTELEDGGLYLREDGSTRLVPETSGEAGTFQLASSDGSVAFFTRGGHLFRYLAASETVTDLTPAGEVEGVLGASADGSRVYLETTSGLFLWQEGAGLREVAAAAAPADWPPAGGEARVSADGRYLAFTSAAEIAGFDNTDIATGLPDTEVYLYDAATGLLTCASCDPTGERPTGSASLPAGSGPYKSRALSADGRRLFYDSEDAASIEDTDGTADVYEWEAGGEGSCATPAGCVSLISSGRSGEPSEFVDASATGSDVFFTTSASLVPSDPGSYDLYDAREGGGFAVPPTPIPCDGDACRPLPSPPEDPAPGTLGQSSGNPAAKIVDTRAAKKGKHHRKKRRLGRRGHRKHHGAADRHRRGPGHRGDSGR